MEEDIILSRPVQSLVCRLKGVTEDLDQKKSVSTSHVTFKFITVHIIFQLSSVHNITIIHYI